MSLEGFDSYAGKRWIYPNNMPVRGYQRTAVEKALFNNAMIVLPTGFGKTFIAAVVMYNFYRWYPSGKIIFVAPTRPLVAQQIQECRKISGIPSSDCIELTGSINSEKRVGLWRTKRVFFATPQVIENDLENTILPAKQVKCIVIDEAHKAQGGYAYANIVKQLNQINRNGFRVLALSATPGYDIDRVRQIMLNLLISEVMFRSEDSLDLMQYKNQKSVRAWSVSLEGKHKEFVDRFIKMTEPIYKELYKAGLTFSQSSIDKVSSFVLFKASKDVQQRETGKAKGRLSFYCSAAISLSHNFALLTLYGIRVFYSSIKRALEDTRHCVKIAMAGKPDFDKMLNEMRDMFGDDIEPDSTKEYPKANLFLGHPKLKVTRDLLEKHFQENADKVETRVMIFAKFRESVYDIVQTLKTVPQFKPAAFVGQGSQGKSGLGMKQKEQIQLVQDFKAGKFNILVATCVAEEGLDIGEVDLIICYDTSSSLISSMQRRGRTGRKRSGAVQTLCTKGYEEKKLKKAGDSRREVEKQLFNRDNYMPFRYREAPRMVPPDITPICLEQNIFPVDDEEDNKETKSKPKRKARKRATKELEDEDDDLKKSKKKKKGFSFADSLLESDDEYETLDDTRDIEQEQQRDIKPSTSQEVELQSCQELVEPKPIQDSASNLSQPKSETMTIDSGGSGVNSGVSLQSCAIVASQLARSDSDIEWEDDLEFNCV